MAIQAHVDRLKDGVPAWNEWRQQNQKLQPDLSQADLSKVVLRDADLSHSDLRETKFYVADLSGANLVGANLENANLYGAKLKSCSLERANFSNANLFGANLGGAEIKECTFDNAFMAQASLKQVTVKSKFLAIRIARNANVTSFRSADLSGADFREADLSWATTLQGADLKRARFGGAKLSGADLRGADLSDVTDLEFDENPYQGARISAHASDRWSVLRRKYTGPNMLINLILFLLFLAPLVAKGGALSAVSYLEQQMIDAGVFAQTTSCSSAIGGTIKGVVNGQQIELHCQSMPMWKLLLGFGGPYGIWMPILTSILIVYQIGRSLLTREVSLLRDAEERSSVSPSREGLFAYPNLYRVHLVLQVIFWISLVTFLLRAVEFLFLTDVIFRGNAP
jgi:uncharacterized protein YjbI with pentapeptide repeats